jgi:hypothetical protein
MRDIPTSTRTALRDGLFIGEHRPIARVTVQHPTMKLRNYSFVPLAYKKLVAQAKALAAKAKLPVSKTTKPARQKGRITQTYADFFFTTMGKPLEMPNIKSVEWSRSTDSDVADCTITVWNTKPLAIGETPTDRDLDQPGWYTYSRGASKFSAAWGQTKNPWFGMLVPDNIIRTYEGYGYDPDVPPEKDGHLLQTGVWMIDSVEMNADTTMSIKCRDVGRLLIDQIAVKPLVPKAWYSNAWEAWPKPTKSTRTRTKLAVKADDSSNTPWIGNPRYNSVRGHKLSYAFDGNPNTYWLSIGNVSPSRRFAYEWVQGTLGNQSVTEVRFRTKKSGYTAYISLKVGGQWIGSKTINYHEDQIGMNGGDIKYYRHVQVDSEGFISVKFDAVAKVQAVRVTLGNLQNFNFGPYRYRGAIRDVEVYGTSGSKGTSVQTGPAGENPNFYGDYTDIVKLLCAWGGFFWPKGGRQRVTDSTGTYFTYEPDTYDTAVLGHGVKGRVIGQLDDAGVAGEADLEWSNFDQKPLMDGISYIRDILGFLFYIDEGGGCIWRLPNIFKLGSIRSGLNDHDIGKRVAPHVIDEQSLILTLQATIDSKNVREMLFVGQVDGKIGAYAPGFNPNPTGIRRVGGWTDQNFATDKECQRMADMISLAQLFTYRTDAVRIPANPSIQIDDQIRIQERVTADGYVHYVKGIQSSLDMETGDWTYDLATHWLGYDPSTAWTFHPEQLYQATQDSIDAQLLAQQAKLIRRRYQP